MRRFLAIPLLLLAALPAFAQQPQRVIDRKFVALNAGYLIAGLLDAEMTQDCIRAGTCVEGNPWMPNSQKGQVGVVLGMTAVRPRPS